VRHLVRDPVADGPFDLHPDHVTSTDPNLALAQDVGTDARRGSGNLADDDFLAESRSETSTGDRVVRQGLGLVTESARQGRSTGEPRPRVSTAFLCREGQRLGHDQGARGR
jgi:hypothetical protein